MPKDDVAEENSKLSINSQGEHDNNIANALSRLKAEANEAMAYSGKGRRDVTDDFTNAAKQLPPGQLVKDEYFTLFEAVGALEIMDPKMDSGYVPPDDTLEADFDPCSSLDANEVIWIMDQLLCLEIIWLGGYPLSQTLYTSLHIDRLLSPDKTRKDIDSFYFSSDNPPAPTEESYPVHKVLLAYCISLIKCCQFALHLIQSQNYYEEEDFVTHLFGRELLLPLGSNVADTLLNEAITWISTLSPEEDIRKALTARCRFRLSLLRTLADDANEWDEILKCLAEMKETRYLAREVPAAFSEKIQRQLATSTPPRPMIQISFDDACIRWRELCGDFTSIKQLTSPNIVQSPNGLLKAVWAFAYRGQPSVLARAQIQNIIFNDGQVAEDISHLDLMLADISDLVLAGDSLVDPQSFNIEVTTDPRHICSQIMKDFMHKVKEEYMNFYRMICQNRCRIRRTFTQAVPILDAVQTEAENVDRELEKHSPSLRIKVKNPKINASYKPHPLYTWCRFHTLRIVAWTVQLGFETEIYLPDELARMYRFLSLICVSRIFLLEHMLCCVNDRKKSLPKTGASKRAAECSASEVFLQSLAHSAEATQYLAEALYRVFHALGKFGVIASPKRDFAAAQLLYEARMKPFLSLKEEDLPCLEDFEEEIEKLNKISFSDTLKSIDECIKRAKAVLTELKKYTPEQAKYVGTEEEWRKETKQMETVCVAIAVTTSQLKRLREKYKSDDLGQYVEYVLEKKYHDWWVIPQLKERAVK